MEYNALLGPIFALGFWTIVMLFWGVGTTLKGVKAADISSAPKNPRAKDLDPLIAEETRWARQNYEHLLEQPVLFYAILLALVMMGSTHWLNLTLAWSYVAFRVIHSIAQATGRSRFPWFPLSTLVLLILIVHGAGTLILAM